MSSPKSDHGAKPVHKPEPVTPEPVEASAVSRPEAASVSEVAVQPVEPANSAEPIQPAAKPAPSIQGLLFPVALTVLAVFPIAIGIGVARVKAAAVAAQANCVVEEPKDDHPEEETKVPSRPMDRGYGDRQFMERRYEIALQCYRSLGGSEAQRLPAELLYRIGLCQEGLGLWDEAVESLNDAAETTDNRQLEAAASFGQVRIWIRQNELDKAAARLISLQLHSGTDFKLPTSLSQEIRFLVPLIYAFETTTKENGHDDLESVQMGELFVWSSEASFAWGNAPTQDVDQDETVADAALPINTFACQVRRKSAMGSNGTAVEEFGISGRSRGQSIRDVLEQVAAGCNWKLDLTTVDQAVALERITDFAVENIPVNVLLTSLCLESNMAWALEEESLVIAPIGANVDSSRRMIARTLESLIADNPLHRFVEHARFALARLAESTGDFTDAAKMYASITGRNSSPLAVRAAYRSGLNFMKAGDANRACGQFGYVVKGAPGHEYHTQSLLYYGQLLLERGEFQTAIFQFRRATEAKKHPDSQAIAAAYLGMTYMMQEKYESAAEAILAYRFHFEDPSVRNAAALVTSLARWKGTSGQMQEREAAFMYRTLVAVSKETDWFGHTGQLFIGRLYLELGFEDQMFEHYTAQLAKDLPEHIAAEMKFSLANYEYAHDRADVARQAWKDLAEKRAGVWSNRSKLRLAEMTLKDGDARGCVDLCRTIRNTDGIARKDLLKLMGHAFEQLGEDLLAARCFAGQLPKE